MSFAILANLAGILVWSLIAIGAAGLLCVAYGTLIERTWYRRASYSVEALPPASSRSLTILHLSDMHMLAGDRRKAAFLASLPQPDICVVTGDILGEPRAVDACVDALRSTRGRLASYFVMGSNDYYAPQPLNYLSYFRPRRRHRVGRRSRSDELRARLEADGWTYLANRKTSFSHDGTGVE